MNNTEIISYDQLVSFLKRKLFDQSSINITITREPNEEQYIRLKINERNNTKSAK